MDGASIYEKIFSKGDPMPAPTSGTFNKKDDVKENKPMETQSGNTNQGQGGSKPASEEFREEWRLNSDRPSSGINVSGSSRPSLREVPSPQRQGDEEEMAAAPFSAVKGRTSDLAHRAQEFASNAGTNLTSFLRQYPTQTLVVGLCVGMVMGMAVSRRT
jgi:hypothetical protein